MTELRFYMSQLNSKTLFTANSLGLVLKKLNNTIQEYNGKNKIKLQSKEKLNL